MAFRITTLADALAPGFDTVIDVRAPAEFAEDHIPGALNLPALSDDERARVGTIYTQVSAFDARKIGAALVARNVAAHLEGPLSDQPGGWRPLLYCWRGGQRSGSVATILRAVGWRAEVIEGGYKSYRRAVVAMLHDAALPHRVVLIDGNTGTAKTDLLHRLAARGAQVIDLEGLANHRGSLLGAEPGGQPAQKGFETRVAAALARTDPARPVLIEAESSKIGARLVPPALWAAMRAAPRIELTAAPGARAAYLARAYAGLAADPDLLADRLDRFRHLRGAGTVRAWHARLAEGDLRGLAERLIGDHYDPAYARARRAHRRETLARIDMGDLGAAAQEAAADAVMACLDRSA